MNLFGQARGCRIGREVGDSEVGSSRVARIHARKAMGKMRIRR